MTLACGGSSAENATYLELAATTTPPSTSCEYKLCGANANVCRIRFDFEVSLFFKKDHFIFASLVSRGYSSTYLKMFLNTN